MSGGNWLGPTVESCLDRYAAARPARSRDRTRSASSATTWKSCTTWTCSSATTPPTRGIALTRPESLNGSPTFTAALAEVATDACSAPSRACQRMSTSSSAAASPASSAAYYLSKGRRRLHHHRIAPAPGRRDPDRKDRRLHHRGRAGQLPLREARRPGTDPRTRPARQVIGSNDHLRITFVRKAANSCPCPTA